MSQAELMPRVNTILVGQGCVMAHERVVDSLGRFHGLYRLSIAGEGAWPELELWKQMLPKDADVQMTWNNPERVFRLVIYYRLRSAENG